MKLFTKSIDKQLFEQYSKGSDLENQKVVAKIFNPYGRGVWYIMNSDPNDPDYLWAIVDLFEPEMGSVSREELETLRVPPFGLGLERDLYFDPKPAKEVWAGLMKGERFEKGGSIAMQNKEMLENQATNVMHHAKELQDAIKKADFEIMPWVLTKMQRAATDLQDITHYLDGEEAKFASGGMTAGRWYKDKSGKEFRYIGESQGKLLFNDGEKIVEKEEDDFEEEKKEKKLFGFFEKGGKVNKKIVVIVNKGKEVEYTNYDIDELINDKYIYSSDNLPKWLIAVRNKGNRNFPKNKEGVLAILNEIKNTNEDVLIDVDIDKPAYLNKIVIGSKQVFEEGGETSEMKEDFLEDIKETHGAIKEITLEDGSKVSRKEMMDAHHNLKQAKYGSYLEKGGFVAVSEKDGYWYIMSKPSTKEKAEEMIALGVPKGEVGKVVTLEEAKAHKKVIGKEYLAKGGVIKVGSYVMYQGKKAKVTSKKGEMYAIEVEDFYPNGDTMRTVIRENEVEKMAKGGMAKFEDKVKAIEKSLLKRKKVSPKVQKDYGKTYNKKEAHESAQRIAGAQRAKYEFLNKLKKGKK